MKETTNLKLKKYDYSDTVDMSTGHNLNMDKLDTEITNVKNTVNNLELTSTKVLRPNTKTVEESLVANETSILALQSVDGKLTDLATTNKNNLVGAINELFQSANSGKSTIATAVGSPLLSTDTFSAMGTKIDTLTSTLKTNLTAKGVTVNTGDKMSILIDKVKDINVLRAEKGNNNSIYSYNGTITAPGNSNTYPSTPVASCIIPIRGDFTVNFSINSGTAVNGTFVDIRINGISFKVVSAYTANVFPGTLFSVDLVGLKVGDKIDIYTTNSHSSYKGFVYYPMINCNIIKE